MPIRFWLRAVMVSLLLTVGLTSVCISGPIEDLLARRKAERTAREAAALAEIDRAQAPQALAPGSPLVLAPPPEAPARPLPLDSLGPLVNELGTLVRVPLPRKGRIRRMHVVLDAPPERQLEDHAAEVPDAYLMVGRKIETSVSFLPGGQLRNNAVETTEAVGVFLHEPALHLYSITFRVLSYKDAKGLRTDGTSPPVGRLEVHEVREPGDFRGKLVKTFENVAFRLGGEETRVVLDMPCELKQRFMVVVSVPSPDGVESYFTIPAASKGTKGVARLDPRNLTPIRDKRRFHAGVRFEYRPDPDKVRPTIEIGPAFVEALQRYAGDHPDLSEVPVRLRVE